MRIRVERGGGFAGIQISNEIDSDDLPSALLHTAKKNHAEQKGINVEIIS